MKINDSRRNKARLYCAGACQSFREIKTPTQARMCRCCGGKDKIYRRQYAWKDTKAR